MRILYSVLISLIFFTACDYQPIEIVQGGIANLPKLPPAEKCLNTLKSFRLDSKHLLVDTNIIGKQFHNLSWKDTILKVNPSVSDEAYFGNFSLSPSEGSCVWRGSLDSFRLYFKDGHQTIHIPNDAIYLKQDQRPEIKTFGNDTTIIRGFKITFNGFSGVTGNMVYEYYLFDEMANRYTRDTLLSSLPSSHIDFERGVVTSRWNGGHVGRIGGRSMYRIVGNGQLEFMKNWHSKPEGDGYRVSRIEMKNGKRVTWSSVVTQDEWQAVVWY